MCRECGMTRCPDGCPGKRESGPWYGAEQRRALREAQRALLAAAGLLPDGGLCWTLDDAYDAIEEALDNAD